ncbi:kinase-like protein [Gigaspora margarita]|uniref:Kinase-like protein n=1 Tax=Gigaspora margarita TaxID=4874 RepID=A0A8H4ALW5_GIGMA|nr:kinase-like protein [Gigaspora margarita]
MLNEIRPPIFEEWFDELRPPILENAETCYVSLMTQCWDSKPDKRPSAAKLVETFTQWQNNEQIVSNLSEFDKEFRILIHVQSEENEEFIYSSENHSDIDDLINEYNTKSTSTDKFLNIDDLIIEYNNKPTSSEKLLILFNTKEMSPAKNSDIPDTLE